MQALETLIAIMKEKNVSYPFLHRYIHNGRGILSRATVELYFSQIRIFCKVWDKAYKLHVGQIYLILPWFWYWLKFFFWADLFYDLRGE